LTLEIWQRLNEAAEEKGASLYDKPGQFQILLSGQILLLKRETGKRDNVNTEGNVTFTDVYASEEVTLKDRTEGIALKIPKPANEIEMYVAFEDDDTKQLVFSAPVEDPKAQFVLRFTQLSDDEKSKLEEEDKAAKGTILGDSKGTTIYGSELFYVKYNTGEKPYLRVNLSQKDSI
jgi:hypothetical protein